MSIARDEMIEGQSRKHSLLESILNVVIGYGVALCAQLAIFPLFGFCPPLRDNLIIGAMFTVVSLVRSYCLRRFFNWLMLRPARRKLTPEEKAQIDYELQQW